jgi:hypothetical protein
MRFVFLLMTLVLAACGSNVKNYSEVAQGPDSAAITAAANPAPPSVPVATEADSVLSTYTYVNDTTVEGQTQQAYVTNIVERNDSIYLDVDYINFYFGDEAAKWAKKTGQMDTSYDDKGKMYISYNEDYIIINQNPAIRHFPVAKNAPIRMIHWYNTKAAEKRDNSFEEFRKRFEKTPFLLTIRDGQVVKIMETYTP